MNIGTVFAILLITSALRVEGAPIGTRISTETPETESTTIETEDGIFALLFADGPSITGREQQASQGFHNLPLAIGISATLVLVFVLMVATGAYELHKTIKMQKAGNQKPMGDLEAVEVREL